MKINLIAEHLSDEEIGKIILDAEEDNCFLNMIFLKGLCYHSSGEYSEYTGPRKHIGNRELEKIFMPFILKRDDKRGFYPPLLTVPGLDRGNDDYDRCYSIAFEFGFEDEEVFKRRYVLRRDE